MNPKGKWPRLSVIFVLSFICVCIPACAKVCTIETFKVRNIADIVFDEHGDVIANAQVEVSKIKAEAISHTLTDTSGRFYLLDIPAGKYELRIQAAGFHDGWVPIVL